MEISISSIKKILIFPEMKPCTFRLQPSKFFPKKPALKKFLIFSPKKLFLYLRKWNPALFSLSSRNKKRIHPEKISFNSGNGNPEKTSYVSGNGNSIKSFLYFRK